MGGMLNENGVPVDLQIFPCAHASLGSCTLPVGDKISTETRPGVCVICMYIVLVYNRYYSYIPGIRIVSYIRDSMFLYKYPGARRNSSVTESTSIHTAVYCLRPDIIPDIYTENMIMIAILPEPGT